MIARGDARSSVGNPASNGMPAGRCLDHPTGFLGQEWVAMVVRGTIGMGIESLSVVGVLCDLKMAT